MDTFQIGISFSIALFDIDRAKMSCRRNRSFSQDTTREIHTHEGNKNENQKCFSLVTIWNTSKVLDTFLGHRENHQPTPEL